MPFPSRLSEPRIHSSVMMFSIGSSLPAQSRAETCRVARVRRRCALSFARRVKRSGLLPKPLEETNWSCAWCSCSHRCKLKKKGRSDVPVFLRLTLEQQAERNRDELKHSALGGSPRNAVISRLEE